MKKITLLAVVVLALSPLVIGAASFFTYQRNDSTRRDYEEKIYVAIEAEGRVGVIDAKTNRLVASIDLSEVINDTYVKYTTHNIQVTPNGEWVLVTANVERGVMGEDSKEENVSDGLYDKVFFIDPLTDTVAAALPIAVDSHLAHIVADKTGSFAYVAAQETGEIYTIDVQSKSLLSSLALGEVSEPHGMRLAADDSKLYVALIGGKAIAEVDLESRSVRRSPFSGSVIQTAVTPDGRYVFGSVYDMRKVAWIDTVTAEEGYIDLPGDAKGAVQLYPTPDSRSLYVVNQGYYFDQPVGKTVYQVNIDQKKVDRVVPVGDAPHGIVINKSGTLAYVTNLLSNDVSIISIETNEEVGRLDVGEMPNGISVWNRDLGGTP